MFLVVAVLVHLVRLLFSKSLNSWAEHFKKAELTIVDSTVMQWLAIVRRFLNYKSPVYGVCMFLLCPCGFSPDSPCELVTLKWL